MAEFRRILDVNEPEPEPTKVTVTMDEETAVRLADFGMNLSKTLGFTVSMGQTVAHLLNVATGQPHFATTPPREPSNPPKFQNNNGPTPIPLWTGNEHDCPEWWFIARDLAKGGKKIDAIKEVRSQTSAGLREAKDYVEYAFNIP